MSAVVDIWICNCEIRDGEKIVQKKKRTSSVTDARKILIFKLDTLSSYTFNFAK